MKFESAPLPQEKLEESAPLKKEGGESFLSRLRKSKTAKALALAGLLGTAGALFENQREKTGPQEEVKYELTEGKEISLGEFSKNFTIKKEVSGKNPLILHIGQIHGADSLAETATAIEKDKLVAFQKDLENLILYLRDTHNLKRYYLEGVEPGFFSVLNGLRAELEKMAQTEEKTALKSNRLISAFDKIAEDEKLPERYRAYLMYALKEAAERELKDRTGGMTEDERFGLHQVAEHMKKHPLIAGNAMYIWGSPMKLFLENRIEVLPAETMEASQKAFASFEDEKDRQNMERRHNIREDAALEVIKQSVGNKEAVVPLIYGVRHDFSDNISVLNKKEGGSKIGLLKISPR